MTDAISPCILSLGLCRADELRAEIERLRSALEMIIDDTYDEAAKTIARRALEPEP